MELVQGNLQLEPHKNEQTEQKTAKHQPSHKKTRKTIANCQASRWNGTGNCITKCWAPQSWGKSQSDVNEATKRTNEQQQQQQQQTVVTSSKPNKTNRTTTEGKKFMPEKKRQIACTKVFVRKTIK